MDKKTAVVILHYGDLTNTFACLKSLLKTNKTHPFYTIVVNNSKDEKIQSKIGDKYPFISVVKPEKNLGFAAGCNMGMKKAMDMACDFVILLNNDTMVAKNLVQELVSFAKKNADVGVISPKIYFAKGYEYHKNRYKSHEKGKVIWYAGGQIDWSNIYATHAGVDVVDNKKYDKTKETDFATGCCMLIKKEVIDTVGFFDPNYFLYFEDVDYSIRAKKLGFKVIYFPKTYLWHKNAASSGKPGSKMHVYYQTRNRLYFGLKYASRKVKKSLIWESIRMFFKKGVYKKAILHLYLKKLGEQKI